MRCAVLRGARGEDDSASPASVGQADRESSFGCMMTSFGKRLRRPRANFTNPGSATEPHFVRVQEIDLGRLHPQLPKKGRHLTAMVALVVEQVQDHAPQWVGPRLPSGTDAGYRALEGFLS